MQTKPPPGSKDFFSCTLNTALSTKTSEKKKKRKEAACGTFQPYRNTRISFDIHCYDLARKS